MRNINNYHQKVLPFFILFLSGFCLLAQPDADIQTEDEVILDDLIVTGSACIGFDCANGLGFGTDTQVLKENNLRILFDDTSNSASFANNDWRILINDSTNGGTGYFSIEDVTGGKRAFTIEAGAELNSLHIDDGGRVGFGTANPVANLHVIEGNTPTLRLEQDGSNGFTPQTWDLAGNETNFFIRDATSGSKLPFRIMNGAPDDAIIIGANGNVGMGTNITPSRDLHVRANFPIFRLESQSSARSMDIGSGSDQFFIQDINSMTNAITTPFKMQYGTPTNSLIISNQGHVGIGIVGDGSQSDFNFVTKELHVVGDAIITGEFDVLSDVRVKKDIAPVENASDQLSQLNPVTYQMKTDEFPHLKMPNDQQYGLIAQEVQKIFPELVTGVDEGEQMMSVNYIQMIPLLIKANQEQAQEITQLKETLKAVLNRIEQLEK